jgi:hypothetical protein
MKILDEESSDTVTESPERETSMKSSVKSSRVFDTRSGADRCPRALAGALLK